MVQSSLGFYSGRTGDDDKAIPYAEREMAPHQLMIEMKNGSERQEI